MDERKALCDMLHCLRLREVEHHNCHVSIGAAVGEVSYLKVVRALSRAELRAPASMPPKQ